MEAICLAVPSAAGRPASQSAGPLHHEGNCPLIFCSPVPTVVPETVYFLVFGLTWRSTGRISTVNLMLLAIFPERDVGRQF